MCFSKFLQNRFSTTQKKYQKSPKSRNVFWDFEIHDFWVRFSEIFEISENYVKEKYFYIEKKVVDFRFGTTFEKHCLQKNVSSVGNELDL